MDTGKATKSAWRSRSSARAALLLCTIALTAWYDLAGASQATTPAPLSRTLRDHLKNERFQVVASIRGLPLGVRDGLQTLFGSQGLDIAEPGAAVQNSAAGVTAKLPSRRLVAAGCSTDHCLVSYERVGNTHTWFVVLFHWTPAETRFEWGGHARGRLATIDDVRSAVLTDAINGPVTSW